jgi:ankyrin repeat protein
MRRPSEPKPTSVRIRGLAIRRAAPLWFPSMRPILRKSNLTRILLGISVVAGCVFAGTQGSVSALPAGRLEAELLEAVRLGDRGAVDALLQKGAAPNAKLPDGTSALMEATVAGDTGMLRALLDRGAEVNTKNQAGATALIWAAGDLDKTRLLLQRGADVSASSDSGRTALMIAAGGGHATEIAQLLIEKGADARFTSNGYTVLMEAAEQGDRELVDLLLKHGANVKSTNRLGWTALHNGAMNGNTGIVADLIAAGADAKATENFHGTTPVHWAAASGNREVVKLLLAHGADPNVKETFTGATPLIWAAASGRCRIPAIKFLVDHGADLNATDSNGLSALDWASRHRTPRELVFLGGKGTVGEDKPQNNSSSEQKVGQTIATSVQASLTLMQRSSEVFLDKTKRGCISCHHQDLPMMAVGLAEERGVNVDRQIAQHQVDAMLEILNKRRERLLEGTGIPDRLDAGYDLMALHAGHVLRNSTTDALVHYLALKQRSDGHWTTTLFRPPLNDSAFTATALSLRALHLFSIPGRTTELEMRVSTACRWLTASKPKTTEDYAFQVLGLSWCKTSSHGMSKSVSRLVSMQHSDGGWAQLSSMGSDAYSTGEVLMALQQSGLVTVRDSAYRRGILQLLNTQLQDGSWLVPSRSLAVQPYLESGFPHGRAQFISCAGTSWATMALLMAMDITLSDITQPQR